MGGSAGKEGHDKIGREFAHARERLAQQPKAATRPDLAGKLDEAERGRHDKLSGKLQEAGRSSTARTSVTGSTW